MNRRLPADYPSLRRLSGRLTVAENPPFVRSVSNPFRRALVVAIAIFAPLGGACFAQAHDDSSNDKKIAKETKVTNHAKGSFNVNLAAQDDKMDDIGIGRRLIDKKFEGDLQGKSKGQMLSGATATQGSAAYVAIEHVTGTISGRSGSFMLIHRAMMIRGAPELSITVLPDSGTADLVGLSGRMDIKIESGNHFYDFEYELPAK